jgi:hypothetical protein
MAPEVAATVLFADLLGCGFVALKIDSHRLAEQLKAQQARSAKMSATLKLTHKAIGVEVRRGTFDVVVDGDRVGSLEMNDTVEIPIEPGHHTLQVRNGRNLSRTLTFDAAEGQVVAFRSTGKRFLPIFLVSFVVPRLALSLRPE